MMDCDNPFWNFSLAVYAAPGVAAECLALQRAIDIDVNALLFCAWFGNAKRIALSNDNLQTIDSRVLTWHETVIRRLRTTRQDIKPMPAMADDSVRELRADIARIELRAEQIEQAMLFELAQELEDGAPAITVAEAIRHNVANFLHRNMNPDAACTEPPKAARLIEEAIAYRPA